MRIKACVSETRGWVRVCVEIDYVREILCVSYQNNPVNVKKTDSVGFERCVLSVENGTVWERCMYKRERGTVCESGRAALCMCARAGFFGEGERLEVSVFLCVAGGDTGSSKKWHAVETFLV